MIKNIAYALVIFLVGGALGYYMMPKKEIVRVVEKQVDRVVTVIKKPDGTVEKITVDKSKIISEDRTKVNVGRSKVNLSLLGGTDFSRPVYGLHVSKELIGPISVGLFGLTNKTVGLSLGINF